MTVNAKEVTAAKYLEALDEFNQMPAKDAEWVGRLLNDVQKGLAVAWCKLGDCYRFGESFKKNAQNAKYWYSIAADRGDLVAQTCLAFCYELGIGVEKDKKKAFKWYRSAAQGGYSRARAILAECYERGTVIWPQKFGHSTKRPFALHNALDLNTPV